jgi:hypothetical protein
MSMPHVCILVDANLRRVMLPCAQGAGDRQAGDDVSAVLTAWGSWQPALDPHRRPSVSEALVGSLGGRRADQQVQNWSTLSPPCKVCPLCRERWTVHWAASSALFWPIPAQAWLECEMHGATAGSSCNSWCWWLWFPAWLD